MYKIIRTAIMKVLIAYQMRHKSDQLLLTTDTDDTTTAMVVSKTGNKVTTVMVTITLDEQEV